MKIAGIILAAGSSCRMGNRNKLMIDINGKTILETVISTTLKAEVNPLIVVLGNDADQIQKTLEEYPVKFVKNYKWETGMSSTIKAGIEALGDDIEGSMILLGDMPGINTKDIKSLLIKFCELDNKKIIYPVKNGQQGNPVIFPKSYFNELTLLLGDRGAKSILNDENSVGVEIHSQGILIDIDTESDLKNYLLKN